MDENVRNLFIGPACRGHCQQGRFECPHRQTCWGIQQDQQDQEDCERRMDMLTLVMAYAMGVVMGGVCMWLFMR